MKYRIKELEIDENGKSQCVFSQDATGPYDPATNLKLTLNGNHGIRVEGLKNQTKPVAIFKDGKLWHTIEKCDASKGDYCDWGKVRAGVYEFKEPPEIEEVE